MLIQTWSATLLNPLRPLSASFVPLSHFWSRCHYKSSQSSSPSFLVPKQQSAIGVEWSLSDAQRKYCPYPDPRPLVGKIPLMKFRYWIFLALSVNEFPLQHSVRAWSRIHQSGPNHSNKKSETITVLFHSVLVLHCCFPPWFPFLDDTLEQFGTDMFLKGSGGPSLTHMPLAVPGETLLREADLLHYC